MLAAGAGCPACPRRPRGTGRSCLWGHAGKYFLMFLCFVYFICVLLFNAVLGGDCSLPFIYYAFLPRGGGR